MVYNLKNKQKLSIAEEHKVPLFIFNLRLINECIYGIIYLLYNKKNSGGKI